MNLDQVYGTSWRLPSPNRTCLEPFVAAHPKMRVVALAVPRFGLIPVANPLAAAVTPAMICAVSDLEITGGPEPTWRTGARLRTRTESGFAYLTPGLPALLEAVSVRGPVSYLEADYSGRDGHQTAAAWRDGALALPLFLGRSEQFVPAQAPISLAFRAVGVQRRGCDDEIVIAGLGRHRRTED